MNFINIIRIKDFDTLFADIKVNVSLQIVLIYGKF